MLTRIYVNRDQLDRNRRLGEDKPVIRVRTCEGFRDVGSVRIWSVCDVVYSDKPLDDGTTVWIETYGNISTYDERTP